MEKSRALPVWLVERVTKSNLYVLRHIDGTALNVSYTEDGLKWTCNRKGKALYFKNAFITKGKLVGDTTPATDVYVEKFVPVNHSAYFKQMAESTWVDKALRLAY